MTPESKSNYLSNKAGSRARFHLNNDDQELYLRSITHSEEDFVSSIARASLSLVKRADILGDERLAEANPSWEKYVGMPMIQILSLRK